MSKPECQFPAQACSHQTWWPCVARKPGAGQRGPLRFLHAAVQPAGLWRTPAASHSPAWPWPGSGWRPSAPQGCDGFGDLNSPSPVHVLPGSQEFWGAGLEAPHELARCTPPPCLSSRPPQPRGSSAHGFSLQSPQSHARPPRPGRRLAAGCLRGVMKSRRLAFRGERTWRRGRSECGFFLPVGDSGESEAGLHGDSFALPK